MRLTSFGVVRQGAISMFAVAAFLLMAAKTDLKPGLALLGSWTFVPEKSKFDPVPAPYQRVTLTFSMTQEGLRKDVEGVDAEGRPLHASYLIVPDGNDHPVTGMRAFDASSYTPVSDTTTVYVRQKRGATVVVGSRVLSRDGRILIFKEKRVDDLGKERGKAFLVFEKT